MPRFYGPGSSFATTSSGATGSGIASTFTLNQLTYMSPLPRDTAATTGAVFTRHEAHCVYVGYVPAGAVIDFAELHLNALSSTATLLGIGVFRSDNAPNKQSTQPLFTVAATASLVLDAGTANVMARNGSPFGATLFTASHLWGVVLCTSTGAASPTVIQRSDDFNEGWARSCTMIGRLTSTTTLLTILKPLPSSVGVGVVPDVRVRLFTGLS
jgi:hypothetical protein